MVNFSKMVFFPLLTDLPSHPCELCYYHDSSAELPVSVSCNGWKKQEKSQTEKSCSVKVHI